MRLKRTLNRRVGDRAYHKWLVADVPPDTIEELGWEEGQELEGTVDADRLVIHPPRAKRKSRGSGFVPGRLEPASARG